jgi:methyltransferase (TIGR00027 family)
MTASHQQWGIGSGVGATALMAAAARAVESSRPDRLINDPFAAAFVNAAPASLPLPVRWPDSGTEVSQQKALLLLGANYVGLRSRFFDDFVRDACTADVRQAVLLAAGLDSRAFRLDWPATVHLFEVDQPAVLEFKDAVLRDIGARARCARSTLAADLRDDWSRALQDNGFDPTVPTAWMAEGVLQYLPAADEQRLVDRIDELSALGSQLAFERSINLGGQEEGLRRAQEVSQHVAIRMDQLIHTDIRPDPTTWLTEHGWTVTDHPVSTVAERYHRDLTDPRLISRIHTAYDNDRSRPAGHAQPAAGYIIASKALAP